MKIVAFVGMPGAGKSLAGEYAKERGLGVLRLGDLTDKELEKRGLERNEENERIIRESLRDEFGMDVYAQKVAEKIDALGEDVVLDGVRSFKEYEYLKEKYEGGFIAVSIVASPKTRQERIRIRDERALTPEEFRSRDKAELEKLDHGSSVAMGDYYILNEVLDREGFKEGVNGLLDRIFIKG
ncbi:MAG: AAA family ATPase [archaeon]